MLLSGQICPFSAGRVLPGRPRARTGRPAIRFPYWAAFDPASEAEAAQIAVWAERRPD